VIDEALLAEQDNGAAIVVPAGVLIDAPLFDLSIPSTATWLHGVPGIGVMAGPVPAIARWLQTGRVDGLPTQAVSPDAVLDISTQSARRRAAWRLLRNTAKPTDGWVSRHCNRPISRLISFLLLSLGLKAWHASGLTLLAGLATAVLALRPGYVTLVYTGMLFQLASVLDGVDGEMARATLTESEAGARLDAVVDQLTYLACFIGITIGWAREGGGPQAYVWMVAIAGALVLSLMRGGRFVSRYASDASFVFIDRAVRRAARDSNLVALRLAAGSFALLRRDLFAVVFLLVALAGRRALIPGLVGAAVVLANVTLSVYRRELEAAAVLERG
jgi:CDP-L-myo-inositol myo-inositolphosphotransferase